MTALKKLLGVLFCLLGLVGLVACVAGWVAIAVYRGPVLDRSATALEKLHAALDAVGTKVDQGRSVVREVKLMVHKAQTKVREVTDIDLDRRPQTEQEWRALEKNLAGQLQQTQEVVQAAKTGADILSRTIQMTSAIPFTKIGKRPGGETQDHGLKDQPSKLARLSAFLGAVNDAITALRKDRATREAAVKKVFALAQDVETEIDDLQRQLEMAHGWIDRIETDTTELQTSLPAWINGGAVAAVLVLFWIALGQVALVRWGFAALRSTTRREVENASRQIMR